jgi:hypothetical protein
LEANFGDNPAKLFEYDIKKCPGMGLEWIWLVRRMFAIWINIYLFENRFLLLISFILTKS